MENTNLKLNTFQKDLLDRLVINVDYKKLGLKTTIAMITTVSGFEIVGASGCVNPKDFNFDIGKHFALVDALTQLGKFDGYYRQQSNTANITVNVSEKVSEEDAKELLEKLKNNLKRM